MGPQIQVGGWQHTHIQGTSALPLQQGGKQPNSPSTSALNPEDHPYPAVMLLQFAKVALGPD